MLRNQAKRIYKEQIKKVPKKQRVPFAEFYKRFKDIQASQHNHEQGHTHEHVEHEVTEDFNFEDLVNVNEISDEELETEE